MLNFDFQVLFEGSLELLFYFIFLFLQLLVHLLLNFLDTVLLGLFLEFFSFLAAQLPAFEELVSNVIHNFALVGPSDHQVALARPSYGLLNILLLIRRDDRFRILRWSML